MITGLDLDELVLDELTVDELVLDEITPDELTLIEFVLGECVDLLSKLTVSLYGKNWRASSHPRSSH